MYNRPITCNWDFKIISNILDENELFTLRAGTIKIKGDPCELVPTKHTLIEFIIQDLDHFDATMILNKLIGQSINIEIARLNSNREPIIKHVYTGCSIVDSHSYNSKLNGEPKTYGKISVKFDWETRNITRIK